ncbi:MAG: DUF4296 domain-containing protein [Eudoraea sp.]|nr:DUF4296 domain-containing protein [Eudoraea sp.]
MKRLLYLFVLLFLTAGCNEKVIEKPENLIAREKMVDILYDLALINSANAIDPKVLEKNQVEPMGYIFSKYGIDSIQFVRSDLYYAAIPLEYEAIYEALEERLETERLRLKEEREKKVDTTEYKSPNRLLKNIKE